MIFVYWATNSSGCQRIGFCASIIQITIGILLRIKFSAGRRFSASKWTTSPNYKPLSVTEKRPSPPQTICELYKNPK